MSVPRPFVLTRYPAVFVAIMAAAMILAISASAEPIFASGVAASAIQDGLRAERGTALSIHTRGVLAEDVVGFRERELQRSLAAVESVGRLITSFWLQHTTIAPTETEDTAGRPARVQLMSRTGFLDHITVLDGATGSDAGVWIAESTAGAIGIEPGDEVTIGSGPLPTHVPVAGVYRDLFVGERDPFWAPFAGAIYPTATADAPPPPVLAERDVFLDLTTRLEDFGLYGWDVQVAGASGLTFDTASRSATALRRLAAETGRPDRPIGAALQAPTVETPLVDVVGQTSATVGSIAGPVGTLALAGEVAALVALAGAAAYTVRRRRTEVRLMHALGLPWTRFAIRSSIESIVPIALGAAAGWAATSLALRAWGPSGAIDASAFRDAAVSTTVAAGVSVVLLGAAAVAAARSEVAEAAGGRVARFAVRAAWEVPILVLAAAALYEITSRGTGPVVGADGIVRIDRFLLLFPILFIAGAAGLIVRGVAAGLARIGPGASTAPVPVYLAVRRLGSSPRIVLLLMTASCLAVGILIYGAAMARSIGVATDDKAHLGIGSDVSATATRLLTLPPAEGLAATNVIEGSARMAGSDEPVTVLGIDPGSFEAAAFWDPRFSNVPLEDLLSSLSRAGTRLPAVVANDELPPGGAVVLGGFDVPIAVVGDASAFPGQGPGATVVLSTPLLEERLTAHGISLPSVGFENRVWVRGPSARGVTYLEGLGLSRQSIRTATALAAEPGFRAVASTFGFMQMLGIVSALVALIGMTLYVQARQRARYVSYAISQRMGLTFGGNVLAAFIEITAIMGTAFAVGGALAVIAGWILAPWIDPLPALAPGPSLHPPYPQLWWAFAVTIAAAGVTALVICGRAERANVAQVLRYAA
jgi:putative ABC transport system permease protein